MMDREIKTQWIAALRGGQFRQCHGSFYSARDDSFCVVGVLLDLVFPGRLREGRHRFSEAEWDGLEKIVSSSKLQCCTAWNDVEHLTFPAIADRIEKDEEI